MDNVQLRHGTSNDYAWVELASKRGSRGNRGTLEFVVEFGTFQRFDSDDPHSDGDIVNERLVTMTLGEFSKWWAANPDWHVVS